MTTEKRVDYAQEFFRLFAGLNRAHGVYRITGFDQKKSKVAGKAITVAEPVTEDKWRAHLQGLDGLGIVPIDDDALVQWGAVDIDVYPLDLAAISEAVEKLDLPCIVCRTKSGGAHVYLFTSEKVPAERMRSRMTEIALALGYPGVEIYPKQVRLAGEMDYGNWLNMPYQNEADTQRYAIFRGHQLTAGQFIELANKLAITHDELSNLKVDFAPEFADAPPCLQAMAASRLGSGNRNNAIFAFGVYCKLKHGDDWQAELEAINAKLCAEPLPAQEMVTIVKSLSRKEYFYPCKKSPCVNLCNRETCLKREFGIGTDDGELNVQLGRLVKIAHTDKPTWIIDVNGVRMEIETEDLLMQARFHKKCVDKINVWPNAVKPRAWHQLVTDRLSSVEVIEPPQDSSSEGRFLQYLEQFCVLSAPAKTQDEILMGRPYTDAEKGRVFFRSTDLFAYLARQRFDDIPARKAWDVLRRHGGEHHQLNLAGRSLRLWSMPRYMREEKPYTLQPIEGEEQPF